MPAAQLMFLAVGYAYIQYFLARGASLQLISSGVGR
jgi:hypothetical protein